MKSLERSRHSFYAQSFEDLEKSFEKLDFNLSGVGKLYNWHYKEGGQTGTCPSVAKKTQEYIYRELNFDLPQIVDIQLSTDRTVKFLYKLQDETKVEAVLIPFQGKYTICLSSQVGCAMNCSFCYTGTQGLTRHLNAHEIVGQFLQSQKWLKKNRPDDDRILNVVFMGQGEPLHNFDAVKKACQIFLSQHGTSLGRNKITISTAGYLPGLKRWCQEMPDVNLALSLHSVFDSKRSQLIPLNKAYPLTQILEEIKKIPLGKKRFITYEYLVLKKFNDSPQDAHALGQLLYQQKALVNLIPFNPYPGSPYQRPDEKVVHEFKEVLEEYKIPTMIRTTKGDDILAACGQLNTK